MSLSEAEQRRSGEFRRWVVVSTLAHIGVFAFFGVSPRPAAGRVTLPAVVEVRMVEAPGAPPAALPEPEPEPAPEPEPPKPKPKPPPKPEKVVLPEKPEARPEPPKAKPRPKPKPAAPPEPEPGYEDLLASLREERGETAPQPTQVADASRTGQRVGGDVLISAEEAAWRRRVKVHVHRSWVLAQGFRLQPLETHVRVRVAVDGSVLELELLKRSGNPWFDESVERALKKASPLPTPPEAGRWDFVFRPEDVL